MKNKTYRRNHGPLTQNLDREAMRFVHPDHPIHQEMSKSEQLERQARININNGLSLFQMVDGSTIWAINEKNAIRKFQKKQVSLLDC